jgi:hypothetical protein
VCSPTVKTHSKPRFGPDAPDDEEEQAAADSDDSDYMTPSYKTKGWFAKLTARLKKSFFFKTSKTGCTMSMWKPRRSANAKRP